MSTKKRFSRGRRPGVKVSQNKKKKKKAKTDDRPNLVRFSMSIPVELARTVRKLKPILDLEYSKMFRYGLGLAVEEWRKSGRIDGKAYDEYQTARHLFRDEDFGVIPDLVHDPDLDREPAEEEWRSAIPVRPA